MPNRWIPIKDEEALKAHGIPYTTATLRRYWKKPEFRALLRKIRGFIYLDLDAWRAQFEPQTSPENLPVQVPRLPVVQVKEKPRLPTPWDNPMTRKPKLPTPDNIKPQLPTV